MTNMRPVLLIIALTSVGLAAASLAACRAGAGDSSSVGTADATARAIQQGYPVPPDPTQVVLQRRLSGEEIARAEDIALHDPAVAGVISKADATVVNILQYGEPGVRIGAIVTIEQSPTDFDGVLPTFNLTAKDDASIARGYGLGQYRVTFVGITRLRVYVDLNSNTVAGVGVDKATSSRYLGGLPIPAGD